MKKISLITICFLFLLKINGQESVPKVSPTNYFNKFQSYSTNLKDVDSATYCLRVLAADKKALSTLGMLLHDIFAQSFCPTDTTTVDTAEIKEARSRRLFAKEVLVRAINDTSQTLVYLLQPLYLLVQAQDERYNTAKLEKITTAFVETQLSTDKLYTCKAARYGLMIHQIIADNPKLNELDKKLFNSIFTYLQNNQINGTVNSERDELNKRAWLRYLYAAANYIKAEKMDESDAKQILLKTAFNFSPDLVDRNRKSSYFYDQFFLFPGDGKESFKDEYLTLLMNSSFNKEKLLPILLQTALIEPEYKAKLKAYYNANNVTGEPFNIYWNNAINNSAVIAPSVLLTTLNKELFSTKQLSGKWIMIDFWGTWCGPCRQEHPDLQKFYDSTVLRNTDKLSLLTIACNDKETAVTDYMKQRKFSFPVAMSDNAVQNEFVVQGYPTKVLISPQGKYVVIPFGSDWINFIKQYCDL